MKYNKLNLLILFSMFVTNNILTGQTTSYEYKELIQKVEEVRRKPIYKRKDDIIRKDFQKIGDNIEKYGDAIKEYLSNDCRKETRPSVGIITFIVCEFSTDKNIRDDLIDKIYETTEYLDAKLKSSNYHVSFMNYLGEKSIPHDKLITYCLEQLQEDKGGRDPMPCFYYLSKIFDNDKRTHKKFLKFLKNDKFYNKKLVEQWYNQLYKNKK